MFRCLKFSSSKNNMRLFPSYPSCIFTREEQKLEVEYQKENSRRAKISENVGDRNKEKFEIAKPMMIWRSFGTPGSLFLWFSFRPSKNYSSSRKTAWEIYKSPSQPEELFFAKRDVKRGNQMCSGKKYW